MMMNIKNAAAIYELVFVSCIANTAKIFPDTKSMNPTIKDMPASAMTKVLDHSFLLTRP